MNRLPEPVTAADGTEPSHGAASGCWSRSPP